MTIKKYKDGKVHQSDGGYDYGEKRAARKASKYIAHAKEKTPHGDVVEGVKRSKRTIGQKKKETQKSKHQKEDLREQKDERKKHGVSVVEKWETGQGPKYKGGKGFKPKKQVIKYSNNTYEEGK